MNIGMILKIIIDSYPDIQIIATGSSSFDLSNKVKEPLTGRSLEFILYPFSLNELMQIYKEWEIKGQLENIGYKHVGDQGIKGREVFKRDKQITGFEILDRIPHHLYVCLITVSSQDSNRSH